MKEYRSEVRLRVLALSKQYEKNVKELNRKEIEDLDEAIMYSAAKKITSPGHFLAFQLAYICKPTWEEIYSLYNEHFSHRTNGLDNETIKKYARDAKKQVFDGIK